MPYDQAAIAICHQFAAKAPPEAVLKEPYLPHIPARWNGILILGCAENLGGDKVACAWRDRLQRMAPESRYTRLEIPDGPEGRPWDNIRVRLALASIWPPIDMHEIAYSNAVPWSTNTAGKNGGFKDCPPTSNCAATLLAIDFWLRLFAELTQLSELRLIVTLHDVAKRVAGEFIRRGAISVPILSLYFPGPKADNIFVPKKLKRMDAVELERARAYVRPIASGLKASHEMRAIDYACYALSEARQQIGPEFHDVLQRTEMRRTHENH